MRKIKKWLALALALCMAVPNVTGLAAADVSVVQAAEETAKTWDEWSDTLKENAAMSVQLTGEEQKFDGTRVLDVSEQYVDSIKNFSTGSIIMRFKANSVASHGVILGARTSTAALPTDVSAKTGNETAMVITNEDKFYMVLSYDRAGLNGPYSFADGNWHTVVLSSSATSGKTFRMTIDGQEMWNLNRESLLGMFTRHTGLDMVTIGGHTDGTNVVGGFNGLISDVIVTTEEISDADAIALSAAGYSGGVEMGSSIAATMTDHNLRDNTWVFTGGEAVQGGFDQTRGIRNYIGQFEEYIRWTVGANSAVNGRQRFTFNTGTAGRTITDVVNNFDSLVAALKTKAVVYMVGAEDYTQGDENLAEFKTSLKSFVDQSLALKDNEAFVIIQKPFAVNDESKNAQIETYCDAVDEVVASYEGNTAKYVRILVVDHYTSTKNDADFKTNKLSGDKLNAQGHLAVSRQFAEEVVNYTGTGYPKANVVLDRVEVEQPEEYLNVLPTATAAEDSLAVVIPAVEGVTSWKYELDMEGTIVSGTANANTFEITGLAAGKDYILKIQSADGTKQLVTTKGTITAENVSQKNVQVLDEKQQKIVDMVNNSEEPLTWLFMGDSITHASGLTFGYDGIAQAFEEFVKEGLGRTDDIVLNTAVANATTATTLQEIDQRLTNYTPDVVSIMIGTNDCSSRVSDITLEVFENNLRTILNTITTNYPDAALLIRSMTPVFNDANRQPYMASYMAVVEELAEAFDAIYVDQYTALNEATTTYASWLPAKMFTDNLHPEANGHRVMTNQFIKACGLWTEDTPMTNLFYEMGITEETNATVPVVAAGADQLGVSVKALEAASGLSLGDVVLKATSAESGQTYETAVKEGEDYVVLNNLPGETTYTVEVSGHLTTAAKKVTFAAVDAVLSDDAEAVIDISLSSQKVIDLEAGAAAGILSVDGLVAEGTYTYTLCEGDGSTDNAMFEISGNLLLVKTALTEGQTYQIRVKAENGTSVKETAFEIQAVGKQLIFEKEQVAVTQGTPVDLAGEDYAEKLFALEEGTIVVKYISTGTGNVQTLFSIANGTTGNNNRHLQVYITPAGRLGCEIRDDSNLNYHIYADNAVTAGALNAIAFKADAENNEYKLFANGELVKTVSAATLGGFKFADDVTGTDTIQIGATKRGGSPAYTFGGTVNNIQVYGSPLSDEELMEATTVEPPTVEIPENLPKAGSLNVTEANVTEGQPFAAGTAKSARFRIPALITLDNGDLLAAADARWKGGADWGGLDTIASVSDDNGETWSYSFPIWFPDTNEQIAGERYISTTAIDPVLVQGHDGTIYCIADMNPSGITTGDIMPAPETGFVEIDGTQRLVLTGTYVQPTSRNWDTYGDPEAYEYYVGDFDDNGFAKVLNKADHSATQWMVDEWYNIYELDAATQEYQPLTQTMVNDTVVIQQNAFYKDSVLHVYNTGYLWLVTSADNGRTWENPTILNTQIKREGEVALLASPGQGIAASNGDIVIPFYDHGDNQENASVIWSSDNGKTWTRSNDVSGMWSSESEVVEINDGVLRMFFRNGNSNICYADFTKQGDSWVAGAAVQTGIPVCSTCNVSAIRHSETIDGKLVIFVACPGGSGRANGKIFTFLVDDDNTMELYNTFSVNNGYYAYSCLTELEDGNLGLLWEDAATAIRYDEFAVEVVLGHEKNITLDAGEEYVEETIADAAKEITTKPDKKVAEITSELVTEESITVLHDHAGAQSSSLDSFSDTAGVYDVTDAEFTFTANGEYWQVSNGSDYLDLSGAGNYLGTATDLTVERSGEYFRIKLPTDNRYAVFFKTNMVFDAYATTDVAGAISSNSNLVFDLVLLEKQESVSENDVIPGYAKAAEIKDGGTYLIAHLWTDGSVIVLYPANGQSAQTKLVGETVDVKKNVITITAIAPGETTAAAGNVTYHITVRDPKDNPAYDGNDIPKEQITYSVGSEQPGTGNEGPIALAFDGSTETFWHSEWSPVWDPADCEDYLWVEFELEEAAMVDAIRYLPRPASSANGNITGYRVEGTADGENWVTLTEGTWTSDGQNWKLAEFTPTEVVGLRLVATATTSDTVANKFASAAELRVRAYVEPETPTEEVCEVFPDVTHGAWYEEAVQYVYDHGIMSGTNGLFKPTDEVTRVQVVTTLYNLEGRPAVTDYKAVDELTDVQADQWYTDAVCWAYNVGVANGNSDTKMFNMKSPVLRQQLATFFYNYAEYKGMDTAARGDYSELEGAEDVSSYAAETMKWAYGTGLITGSKTTVDGETVYNLNPRGTATRAQMASILMRFCEGID